MLWILTIIGFLILIMGLKRNKKKTSSILITICILVIFSSLIGLLVCITENPPGEHYEEVYQTQEIVAVHNNNQVVYVKTGDRKYYFCYSPNKDGSYEQVTLSTRYTTIFEEENCENPRIITYATYTKPNAKLLHLLTFLPEHKWESKNDDKYLGTRIEIHVPKGTVS